MIKITPFEAHMGRKANTPLSNITTNSSPSNLNWENAKYACLDRKILTHPQIHDLQKWSEDELCIKRRISEPIVAENTGIVDNRPHITTGVKTRKAVALEKRLYLRYKGIQQQTDPIIKKKVEQVARKTIRLATKVKDPKIFEQKNKRLMGKS